MPARPAHQLSRGAVSNDTPAVDDERPVAHGFHFLEDMGGDDDRLVPCHLLDEQADLMLLVGIETIGRLIHDEHVRIMQDRLRQADAPLEAL